MENNIYESIQEWFELQQQGIITEKEFQDKKAELLSTVKKQTTKLTNKSQSKEIKPIENSTVEFSQTLTNKTNVESNKFFELVAKYKFYIILITLALIMTISYFKNFYNEEKKATLEITNENSDNFNSIEQNEEETLSEDVLNNNENKTAKINGEEIGANSGEIITNKSYIYKESNFSSITKMYLIKGDIFDIGEEENGFYDIYYHAKNNKLIEGFIPSEEMKLLYLDKYGNKTYVGE